MLSFSICRGTEKVAYYLDNREDYYLSGEESLSWYGPGAQQVGLTGKVRAEDFRNLFSGQTPDGQRAQNHGKPRRVAAVDGTLSVDKHTCCLWSQSSAAVRAEIEQAVQAAWREDLLPYVNETCGWTRRGQGGRNKEKVDLIAASKLEFTARETKVGVAPQVHLHCLYFTAVKTADGKTRCLDLTELLRRKMELGALFRASYTARIERRLGIEYVQDGWKVQARGPKTLDEFADFMSQRRKDTARKMKLEGVTSARGAEKAALSTRRKKGEVEAREVFAFWTRMGKKFGFTRQEAEALLGQAPRREEQAELRAALQRATDQMTREKAVFEGKDFTEALAVEASGRRVDARQVIAAAKVHLHSQEIIRLGTNQRGQEVFTTRENLQLETRLLEAARDMAQKRTHRVAPKILSEALSRDERLSVEQQQAVRHLVESGQVAVCLGLPGVGKTTLLNHVREVYEASGYRVLGTAISARACAELRNGAGLKTTATIAKLVGSAELGFRGDFDGPTITDTAKLVWTNVCRSMLKWKPLQRERMELSRKDILVIDEVGMVGSKALERLLREAKEKGAKVILSGDHRQIQPIGESGAPLYHLANTLGAAQLHTILRQKDRADRDAIEQHARGQVEAALKSFARRGCLAVADTRDQAAVALVADWKGHGGLTRPEKILVLARRRSEVAELNEMLQRERRTAGRLGVGVRHGDGALHVRDRVMCTKNSRYYRVHNGDRGTVVVVNRLRKKITIQLDDSRRKVTLPLNDYGHVSLAYCQTVHKSQGGTAAHVLVLGSDLQSKELSFVELSRHRDTVKLFVPREQAGENLAALARAMSRSERKEMAYEYLQRGGKQR